MTTTKCRDCAETVSSDAFQCPHCGAPRPAWPEWNGEGYEWKSAATIGGLPWVHVAFGIGRDRRVRTARGVIAIGQRAVGGIAVGILALGVISCGIVAGGVLSLGVVAVGAAAACGVNAIAPAAFGVVAVGMVGAGVHVVAWKVLFSVTQR
jgi:hypothetical protein